MKNNLPIHAFTKARSFQCKRSLFFWSTFVLLIIVSCKDAVTPSLFSMDNVFAWCIVPFDSEERSPSERIQMLQELGFEAYAYDWREKHLQEMATEIQLAQDAQIEINAVWMWIDARNDSVGHLSSGNEKVLEILEKTGLETTVWVSFHANFFSGLSQSDAVEKGREIIAYLSDRTKAIQCKLALYNHGEWFGEPQNQIALIKALPERELGIIYNFHHAHLQLEAFPELVKEMTPYLWAVNLNGMKAEGPKILTIGQGDREAQMISTLKAAGFTGPWGILGHIESEDVQVVLKRNLEGLQALNTN